MALKGLLILFTFVPCVIIGCVAGIVLELIFRKSEIVCTPLGIYFEFLFGEEKV